ncbi:flagellin [Halobacillus sp. MO56]
MRINHNIAALNTYRQLGAANNAQQGSMEKLSSGLRINRAGDDAAGLAISEKMRGQIRGLEQASTNAQDGISLIQTAEGALNETHSILQRMRELGVQANNDTNTNDDLAELQKEFDQLSEEVTRIGNKTEFNTKTLLDGSVGATGTNAALNTAEVGIEVKGIKDGSTVSLSVTDNEVTASLNGVSQTIDNGAANLGFDESLNFDKIGLTLTNNTAAETDVALTTFDSQDISVSGNDIKFQIGANQDTVLNISVDDMRSTALGVGASASVTSLENVDLTSEGAGFDENIKVIDQAIKEVSAQRSQLGAWQNRLDHTINNLGTTSENLTAAESRIRDVDMAKEMMNQTKNSILAQASQAMLAQSQQLPQGVLQLLR